MVLTSNIGASARELSLNLTILKRIGFHIKCPKAPMRVDLESSEALRPISSGREFMINTRTQ